MEERILAFLKNHKKSSLGGIAQYLGITIEQAGVIIDTMPGDLIRYVRSDGLVGVRLAKPEMWKQGELFTDEEQEKK